MPSVVFTLLKVLLVVLVLAFGSVAWKHLSTMRRMQFYKDQNITVANGYERFFLGNILDVAKRDDLIEAG